MSKIEEPAREGFLYHLWLDRTFETVSLKTIDGRPVKILEKGGRNYDAGPDFLSALVRINAELLRGDVEIHSIAGDWYSHGHHNDPRYNDVVLHIVTMDCPSSFRTICQNGSAIPTLNLDSFLEKSAEELEIDVQIKPAPSTSCALSRQTNDIIHRVVEQFGDKRLSLKADRFFERRISDSWDQLFYASLLEALGYSKNQIPFRQLAEIMPVEMLWRFVWNDPQHSAQKKCEALLFGAAGLLPSQSVSKGDILDSESRRYVNELEDFWASFPFRHKVDVLKPGSWQFFRLRPANFPTRRIIAAASFVVRFMQDGFVGTIEKVFANFQQKRQLAIRELENLFILPTHEFWSERFSFEDKTSAPAAKKAHILGAERARDIVVNVALPALTAYAVEIDDARLKITVSEIYNSYPLLRENEITRQMNELLFCAAKNSTIISSARMQQGLIYLSKQMCGSGECNACLAILNLAQEKVDA
jgi:hypothetical protein